MKVRQDGGKEMLDSCFDFIRNLFCSFLNQSESQPNHPQPAKADAWSPACVRRGSKPSEDTPMFDSRFRCVRFIFVFLLLTLPLSAAAQTAHFDSALISWGSLNPYGVAVDANGNIFFADGDGESVGEIPPGCKIVLGGQTTCINWFYGFFGPTGVAVDAQGNVFVADNGNKAVKEILAVNGSIPASPTINTLGGGFSFSSPWGVAVDANGNVFVSDNGNLAVYELPATGGYSTVKTIVSKFTGLGITVDASDNIFAAGAGYGTVTEYLASESYATAHKLGGGFTFDEPYGVALDSGGNLYIIDYSSDSNPGANAVFETTKSSGYNVNNVLSVAFKNANGIGVDASGNVYVGDTGNGRVVELQQGAANFGTVNMGTSSAIIAAEAIPLTFTFDTGGTLGATAVLAQGVTGLDFADAGTGSCKAGTAYTAGEICTLIVTFNPLFDGLREGAADLKDSNGNIIAMAYVYGVGAGPEVGFPPYRQSALMSSGLAGANGIAVDDSGNVFVAGGQAYGLKEAAAGCASSACVKTLGSGFKQPTSVALDGSGNLIVADYGNGAVERVLAPGYSTVQTLASIPHPQGVAVDGSGNVFVTAYQSGKVYELMAAGGMPRPTNWAAASPSSGPKVLRWMQAGTSSSQTTTAAQCMKFWPRVATPRSTRWAAVSPSVAPRGFVSMRAETSMSPTTPTMRSTRYLRPEITPRSIHLQAGSILPRTWR